jgi:hypothetical protein
MTEPATHTHEELKARIEEQIAVYAAARDRIAVLTLVDILVSVRSEYPTARFVGLADSDQDFSGMQTPTVIVLEGSPGTTIEAEGCLDDVPVSNLDNLNRHIWEVETVSPADVLGSNRDPYDLTVRFLDLDRVEVAEFLL